MTDGSHRNFLNFEFVAIFNQLYCPSRFNVDSYKQRADTSYTLYLYTISKTTAGSIWSTVWPSRQNYHSDPR